MGEAMRYGKLFGLLISVFMLSGLAVFYFNVKKLHSSPMVTSRFIHFEIHSEVENAELLKEMDSVLEAAYLKSVDFFGLEIGTTNVYVYEKQGTFQNKKYPILSLLLDLSWYIGDNIGENVLIVSPSASVAGHSYESIMNAAGHEFVHTVVYRIAPKSNLWLNEGLALYLSNRNVDHFDLKGFSRIPNKDIWYSNNPVKFSNHGGYDFADKFVEYIVLQYGKDALLKMLVSDDFSDVLKISDDTLFDEWVQYLEDIYA